MTAIIATRLAGTVHTRRSATEWRALMRAYARSSETRKQFCARHGIAMSTFAWWRRRLRQDPPRHVASRSSSSVPASAVFVELSQAEQPSSAAALSWAVELDLGCGVFLRLRRAGC